MTDHLNLTTIAQGQNQPETPSNDADRELSEAMNDSIDVVVSGSFGLAAATFTRAYEIDLTGTPAGAFDMRVPATNRNFLVTNNTGQTATVGVDDGASGFLGTTVLVADGDSITIYADSTDAVATGGAGGGSVAVEDEGVQVVGAAATFDFQGAGVTVSDGGAGQANIVIPGSGGGTETIVFAPSLEPVGFGTPRLADFPTAVQGATVTGSATDIPGKGLLIIATGVASSDINGRVRTTPSTPWTATTFLKFTVQGNPLFP